jgi:microsomal triglyceride transfer protein large subunit
MNLEGLNTVICAQITGEVRTSLVDGLLGCTNEECKQKYLRALKNLGLKDTVPVLLQHALHGSKKTSVTALKALRSLPPDSWDDDVKRAATRIYYQLGRRFDSSSRTLAADILLESRPSDGVVRDLLLSLASRADPVYEVSEGNAFSCAMYLTTCHLPIQQGEEFD